MQYRRRERRPHLLPELVRTGVRAVVDDARALRRVGEGSGVARVERDPFDQRIARASARARDHPHARAGVGEPQGKGGPDGAKDAAGNPLASDVTWTFTTAPAAPPGPETVTLTPAADSYVSSQTPNKNYGAMPKLWVDNSPVEVMYLKFDLSAYAGRTLASAALQVSVADNASVGKQNVKLVGDDSWTEGGLNYNNRPAPGSSLGIFGPTTIGSSYTVPLTVDGLAGELGQQLTLGLDTPSTDGLALSSKEAGGTAAPKLVLTFQ